MSLTRIGPGSDVFVYSSVNGTWVVSVAAMRFTPAAGQPIPVEPTSAHLSPADYEHALQMYRAAVAQGSYVPIGGSADGLTYEVASAAECADLLRKVMAAGYQVPASALQELDRQAAQPPVTAHL